MVGRGSKIRTCDPLLPKQMRYQAAPCPDARYSATRHPVLRQGDIDGFRVTRMMQDKTQFAGNGESFSRTATPYWIIRVAPHFERRV